MNKKRIVWLVLVILSAFTFFSACQKNNVIDQGSEGHAADGFRDMEGKEFVFRGGVIPKNPRDYTDEEAAEAAKQETKTPSLEEEKMLEAVDTAEKNMNCKIIRRDLSGSASEFAASYATGQSPTDFFYSEIRFARDLYIAGYIAPINDIEAIDPSNSEKWGNENKLMSTTYKGVLYGLPCVGSNYYPYPSLYYGILMCNMDTFNSFNYDVTPREMIENGQWTFSGFLDLLPNFYTPSESGDTTNSYFSFVHSGLPICAVYANGGDIVVKKRNKYVFGYGEPNAIRALEWASRIYNTEGTAEGGDIGLKQFANNQVTFYMTSGYRAFQEISQQVKNYIWLPFPYGPDVEYGSTYTSYTTYQDGIMAFMKDTDPQRVQDAGYVMNVLFDPTPHFGKEGYDRYLYRNFFNDGDTESFQIYKDLSANMHYNYQIEMGDELFNRFTDTLNTAMYSNSSIANSISTVESLINMKLDEEMN